MSNDFMGNDFMGNDLGYTINPEYDMNTHIEQGVQFNKNIIKVNEHPLLEASSSPEWGSIVEAFNDENSINRQKRITLSPMREKEANFNNRVSQYARNRNEYNSTGMKLVLPDEARIARERLLDEEKNTIIASAKDINSDMKQLREANKMKKIREINEMKQLRKINRMKEIQELKKMKQLQEENELRKIREENEIKRLRGINEMKKIREITEMRIIREEKEMIKLREVNERIKQLRLINNDLTNAITNNQMKIKSDITELNQYHADAANFKNKIDSNSLAGAVEVTELNMTSMYYHYLVYFILSITLIAFTFNIIVNPDANVMSALFIVVALVVVYLISRYYLI